MSAAPGTIYHKETRSQRAAEEPAVRSCGAGGTSDILTQGMTGFSDAV